MAQQETVAEKVRESLPPCGPGVRAPRALWKFPELLYAGLHPPRPGLLHRGRARQPSPRACRWCGRAASRPGSPSCTAATTSAPTASCPMSGAGSGAGTRRRFWRRCGSWWPRGTRTSPSWAQNVNSYGKDLEICPWTLPTFWQRIDLEIPGDYLIRFMTSHPKRRHRKAL